MRIASIIIFDFINDGKFTTKIPHDIFFDF